MNLQDYEAMQIMLDHITPFAIAGFVCMVLMKLLEVKVAGKRIGWLPNMVTADQLRKSKWRVPYLGVCGAVIGLGAYVGVHMLSVLPNVLNYTW
ncbi:hypothetical protein [Bacillus thuringiensis]|uniref:hypothetical protein n=1 Tax=Bacillus thuringiensis TaxID=1428 RepID=UPI000BFBBF3C|nr:hypothetical protein [Bacillus thuringiensis]PGT90097.1 hypothetical protein COD17_10125 [Bacillus thuringiensis]